MSSAVEPLDAAAAPPAGAGPVAGSGPVPDRQAARRRRGADADVASNGPAIRG